MMDSRGVALALVLSVALHAGLALMLRGLGMGPAGAPAAPPPLYVDLVESLVAIPDGRNREAMTPSRPASRSGDRRAPSRAPVIAPSTPSAPPERRARSAESPTPEPPAPPAAPPVPAPASPGPPAPAPPVVSPPEPGPRRGEPVGEQSARREAEDGRPGSLVLSTETGAAGTGGVASDARAPRGPSGSDESAESRGSGTTRADGLAAPPGRGSQSAALGTSRAGGIPPEYERFVQALRRRIQERLRYPWLAVRQGLAGVVELEVRLDAGGRLIDATPLGRDPPRVLREAAVQAVREATPFPFPADVEARALTIRLPIVFELR